MQRYLTKEAQKEPFSLCVCVQRCATAFFSDSSVILSWIISHSERHVMIIILCNFAPPVRYVKSVYLFIGFLLFFTRKRVKRNVGSCWGIMRVRKPECWASGEQLPLLTGCGTLRKSLPIGASITTLGTCHPHLPAHTTGHNIQISLFGSKQIYRFSNILTNLQTKIREKQLT